MRKNLRRPQRILLSGILMGTIACDSGFLPRGKSVFKQAIDPLGVKLVAASDPNLRGAMQVRTLAIGRQIIAEMVEDAKELGLNDSQALFLTTEAERELSTQVGQLSVPGSLALAEEGVESSSSPKLEPVMIASPLVVQGALKAFGQPELDVGDTDTRTGYVTGVIAGAFTSLNGKTGELGDDRMALLASEISASAVQNLKNAGLTQKAAISASRAVTVGAVNALKDSGAKAETLGALAKAVVKGAVSKMQETEVDEADRASMIGQVTAGAIGAVQSLGSSEEDSVALVGGLASTAMESMVKLGLSEAAMLASVKDVSREAVGALGQAHLVGVMDQAVQSIAQQMVSSLGKSSLDTKAIQSSAGAVASGAVAGIHLSGMSEKQLAASGAVTSIMKGTLASLSATGLSTGEIASSMTEIVGGAIAGLGESSARSNSARDAMIGEVINGTMSSFATAGLTDATMVAVAVTNLSKGATEALPMAGVTTSKLGQSAALIARKTISAIGLTGMRSADDINRFAKNAASGVMVGVGTLAKRDATFVQQSTAFISQAAMAGIIELAKNHTVEAAAVTSLTTEMTSGMMQGLVLGGASTASLSSLQADIRSTAVISLQNQALGISSAQMAALATSIDAGATSAIALATKIRQNNFVACSPSYSDSLSDDAFAVALAGKLDGVLCRSDAGSRCPKRRAIGGASYEWLPGMGGDNLCQMYRFIAPLSAVGGVGTTATATTNPAPIIAMALGLPVGLSSLTYLTATVQGNGVDFYRYKLGSSSLVGCGMAMNYMAPVPVGTGLVVDVGSYADGPVTLCLIGGSIHGNWQKLSEATQLSWTKVSASQSYPTTTTTGTIYTSTGVSATYTSLTTGTTNPSTGDPSSGSASSTSGSSTGTITTTTDSTGSTGSTGTSTSTTGTGTGTTGSMGALLGGNDPAANGVLAWSSSVNATRYELTLHAGAGCGSTPSYSFTVYGTSQPLASVAGGNYFVCLTAIGNANESTLIVTNAPIYVDKVLPTTAFNLSSGELDGLDQSRSHFIFKGTASDNRQLSRVELSVSNGSGYCLDRTDFEGRFVAACPTYLQATYSGTQWIHAIDQKVFLRDSASVFTIAARAVDVAGNLSASAHQTVRWRFVPKRLHSIVMDESGSGFYAIGQSDGRAVFAYIDPNNSNNNWAKAESGHYYKVLQDDAGATYWVGRQAQVSGQRPIWTVQKYNSQHDFVWKKNFIVETSNGYGKLEDAILMQDNTLVVTGRGHGLLNDSSRGDWWIKTFASSDGTELAYSAINPTSLAASSSGGYCDPATNNGCDAGGSSSSGAAYCDGSMYPVCLADGSYTATGGTATTSGSTYTGGNTTATYTSGTSTTGGDSTATYTSGSSTTGTTGYLSSMFTGGGISTGSTYTGSTYTGSTYTGSTYTGSTGASNSTGSPSTSFAASAEGDSGCPSSADIFCIGALSGLSVFVDPYGSIWLAGIYYQYGTPQGWKVVKLDANLNPIGQVYQYNYYMPSPLNVRQLLVDPAKNRLHVLDNGQDMSDGSAYLGRLITFDMASGNLLNAATFGNSSYAGVEALWMLLEGGGEIHVGVEARSGSHTRDVGVWTFNSEGTNLSVTYFNTGTDTAYTHKALTAMEWKDSTTVLLALRGLDAAGTPRTWVKAVNASAGFSADASFAFGGRLLVDSDAFGSRLNRALTSDPAGNRYVASNFAEAAGSGWLVTQDGPPNMGIAAPPALAVYREGAGAAVHEIPVDLSIDPVSGNVVVLGRTVDSGGVQLGWWVKGIVQHHLVNLIAETGPSFQAQRFALDSYGGLYVAGSAMNVASGGSGRDIIVKRYMANGVESASSSWPMVLDYINGAGGLNYDRLTDVHIDRVAGRIYLLASIEHPSEASSNLGVAIAAYDLYGAVQYAFTPDLSGMESFGNPLTLDSDSQNNLYVGGTNSYGLGANPQWWVVPFHSSGYRLGGSWYNLANSMANFPGAGPLVGLASMSGDQMCLLGTGTAVKGGPAVFYFTGYGDLISN